MNATELVGNILEHHGVKGMKWGVRKEAPTGGGRTGGGRIRRAGRALGRGAQALAFEINTESEQTHFEIVDKASTRLVRDLPRIKARHGDYGNLSNRAKKPFSKEARAYRADVKKTYLRHLERSANEIKSPSGKRQYTLSDNGKPNTSKYFWEVSTQEVQHANGPTALVHVIFDNEGYITDLKRVSQEMAQGVEVVDDILTHHGIKGMKWGVRNRSSAVSVRDKGKKLKTSGGHGRPAHADAVTARTTGQIAKKSGVKALSDNELRHYANRLQLEQNVARLQYNEKPAAQKFVARVLGRSGDQAMTQATKQTTKKIGVMVAAKQAAKVGAVAVAA